MREATGSALLIGMVASIIAVIMIFFVGSLSYSKSYKIKNHILDMIEQEGTWNEQKMSVEVNDYLKDVGYNVVKKDGCPTINKCSNVHSNANGYNYCVYECKDGNDKYYKVITFMKFDFPVIGSMVQFEVKGETKTFNKFN